MSYAENRKKHLENYAKKNLQLRIGGKWQRKEGDYPHILKFEGETEKPQNKENKYKVVCEYNILTDVSPNMFKQNDMHRYAHHLNSSQVLCYNYFRPLIKDKENSNPTNELIKLLEKQKIAISSSATCRFEYCPNKEEGTHFDFYIKDGDIEVFFEIKYTEYGFGKAKPNDYHIKKFTTIYGKYLNKQSCLKSKPDFDEFADHYQLYRNIIRITDKNKYVILLYPKNNEKAEKEAKAFISGKIKEEYKNNILCLYWEDIVKQDSELYRKYFAKLDR